MTETVLSRVGRQSCAYGLASVVAPVTGLLLLPLYTRYLTPAEYGLIAVLEVIALILSAIFSLGLPALIPFLYVDRQGVDRKRAVGTVVAAVTIINSVLSIVALSAGAAVVGVFLPSVPFRPYVPLVIFTALVEPYWVIAGASMQIQEEAGRFAVWSTARVFVSVAARVTFVVVLAGGALGFIAANLATAAVFAIVGLWLLRSEMAPAFSTAVIREGFQVGGPTVPNNLLSYAFRLLDRIVLERYVTLEQVGLYYLALRLADVMRLAGDVLVNAWRPVFFKQADDETFRKEDVPRVIRLATVVLAGVFVMLSVFSREVVAVFAAPAYQQAYVFVPFLAGAMLFKGVQSFPYLVIWLRRKTSWVPVLSIFTFVVSIAANVAFARRWGAMGVAAALFAAYVFLSVAMFLVARRLYNMNYPWRTLLSVAVLSIGAVAASESLPEQPLAIVGKFGIAIGYACGLIVSGSVRPDELRALRWSEAMPGSLDRKTAVS